MHLPSLATSHPFLLPLLLPSILHPTLSLAQGTPRNATTPSPIAIPLNSLATSFPNAITPFNATTASTIEQIRNTLALYPFAIDGKDFDALGNVFSVGAVADYSTGLGVLDGLDQIKSVLKTTLEKITTQHSFGTQIVDVGVPPTTATSITYYTASQFGTGPQNAGKVVYSYGQYQDHWRRQPDTDGAGWRIESRSLVYMGPNLGDLSIFT